MFHRRRARGSRRHGQSSLRQRQQRQPIDGDGRQRRGWRFAQSKRQTPAPGIGRIWKSTRRILILRDGRVVARGAPERSLTFTDLARLALPGPALKSGITPGISEEDFFATDKRPFPYGVHVAAVEVDQETGKIKILDYLVTEDVGRKINPMIIEGQMAGGLAQGIGGAMLGRIRLQRRRPAPSDQFHGLFDSDGDGNAQGAIYFDRRLPIAAQPAWASKAPAKAASPLPERLLPMRCRTRWVLK